MNCKKLFASLLITASAMLAQAAEPLHYQVITADERSFGINATLLTGSKDALLVGSGFTKADAYRIAAAVLDSGKELKTILVSDADPDYYFGAEVLHGIFPKADIVASAVVVDEIKAKLPNKLKVWVPQMGANAPGTPVLPRVLESPTLTLEGQAVELRGTEGVLANRPYVWVPSLKLITGNVALWSNLHVWTADTQTPEQRKAWLTQLDEMQALHPAAVIPGHMKLGDPLDGSSITFTRTYLRTFLSEIPKAKDGDALNAAMQKHFPKAGVGIASFIGAKVAKGEMAW